MKKRRFFSTQSRPLVEFLYAKGHPVVEVYKIGPTITYVLPKTPNLEALVGIYRFGTDTPELYVHVCDFQQAQRQLEQLIHENTGQPQII
jgi:hypothetical protein